MGGERSRFDRLDASRLGPIQRCRRARNHEILGLHHVREGAGHRTAYDLGFLAVGALLILGGWLLARSGKRVADRSATR